MKRIEKAQFLLCVALLWFAQSIFASSNSNPGLYYGQIPTAGQWNSYFSSKLDYLPGTLNSIPYWDGAGNFLYAPVSGDCTSTSNVFTCNATSAVVATRALNLSGGAGGSIPYQSGVNATAMLANGTAGYVLTSNGGTAAPSWNVSAISGFPYADATGTADAITASYTVANGTLIDGYDLTVEIITPNATTTPTFAPTLNGSLQTARTIVKFVGNTEVALAAGDLQGDVWLKYDSINLKWILQNPGTHSYTLLSAASGVTAVGGINNSGSFTGPYTDGLVTDYSTGNGRISVGVGDTLTFYASGVANTQTAQLSPAGLSVVGGLLNTTTSKLPSVSATVAGNAMTVGASSVPLDFRSATLGSGAVTTVTAAPTSLIIPSGATLGTTSAVMSRIVVAEMNNGGTAELAVANIAGGLQMDETNLITTTAISAAASASNVWYSNTARTNLPYRVVGYVESTQATAGTWAASPSTIQGAGGNAETAMGSLGYGQTWQDLTASRVSTTTYYNTTGKPIFIKIISSSTNIVLIVNGTTISAPSNAVNSEVSAIIPPGASYVATATITKWFELR